MAAGCDQQKVWPLSGLDWCDFEKGIGVSVAAFDKMNAIGICLHEGGDITGICGHILPKKFDGMLF